MKIYKVIFCCIIVISLVVIYMVIGKDYIKRKTIDSNENQAISSLIYLAMNLIATQTSAVIDQDNNGTGEYLFLQEWSGVSICRGDAVKKDYYGLIRHWGQSAAENDGVAIQNGYCFYVYLPGEVKAIGEKAGNMKIISDLDAISEQEAWFVIYAWPVEPGKTGNRAFVINQAYYLLECRNHPYCKGRLPNPEDAFELDYHNRALNVTGNLAVNKMGHNGLYWKHTLLYANVENLQTVTDPEMRLYATYERRNIEYEKRISLETKEEIKKNEIKEFIQRFKQRDIAKNPRIAEMLKNIDENNSKKFSLFIEILLSEKLWLRDLWYTKLNVAKILADFPEETDINQDISKKVIPLLVENLKDGNRYTRRHSILILMELRKKAKAALPALQEALKDSDTRVRNYAKEAIEKIEKFQ